MKEGQEFDDEWGTLWEWMVVGRECINEIGEPDVKIFDGFLGVSCDGFVLVDEVGYVCEVLFSLAVCAIEDVPKGFAICLCIVAVSGMEDLKWGGEALIDGDVQFVV